MRVCYRILLVCAFLGACGAIPAALAQTPQREFERALRDFDRRFEEVQRVVEAFDSRKARQTLLEAKALRDAAEEAFRNRRFAEAQTKLKTAFAKLEWAEKELLRGPADRWRTRIEELLRQAEHEILNCGHPEAQRLLQEARKLAAGAQRAGHQGDVRVAVERYRLAETQLNRALKLVRSLQNKVQEARQHFEILNERARELLEQHPNDRADQVYRRALKLAESAEEALQACKLEAAQRFFNQSTMLLVRAMDLAGAQTPGVVNQADLQLFRLRELMEEVRDCVRDSRHPRAQEFFDRARGMAAKAEADLKAGRSHQALYRMRVAENLLRRACQMSRAGGGQEVSARTRDQLEQTRADLAEMRRNLSPDTPKDVQVLLNLAQAALNRSQRAAESGFQRFALEGILVAERFLARAERLRRGEETPGVTPQAVQLKLKQLDEAIRAAEENAGVTSEGWSGRFLTGAKEIRRSAVSSLQSGNYRAANAAIDVALDLARKSLRNPIQP